MSSVLKGGEVSVTEETSAVDDVWFYSSLLVRVLALMRTLVCF